MSRSNPVADLSLSDNWLVWAIGGLVSAFVSYFTTTGTLKTRIAQLEEREANHYLELKNLLLDMRADLKAVTHRSGR